MNYETKFGVANYETLFGVANYEFNHGTHENHGKVLSPNKTI